MDFMNSDSSFLAPSWSRIIHRLHSLGCVKSSYINSIGSLTEIGRYPQHIPSYSESESQSIDGSTFWNFLNWYQGWIVKPTDTTEGSMFSFSSINNQVFHKLSLMESHHDECLDCLLRLFATTLVEREPSPQVKRPNRPASTHAVANILEQALNNNKQPLKLDFITEGGFISKSLFVENLKVRGSQLLLEFRQKSALAINVAAISHVQRQRMSNTVQTTFYNARNSPQLSLQICS